VKRLTPEPMPPQPPCPAGASLPPRRLRPWFCCCAARSSTPACLL